MRSLYPAIQAHTSFFLKFDATHSCYVEESGASDGVPVVFLHGGPGAGCEDWHRRFFHPQKYRIILFDQRGCGRSTPHAEIIDNTTQLLLADMEQLRETLGIERWVVFGGSWGTTLALAYAETYPERCLGLILRGIFLCRRQDVQWFYQAGANQLFPDLWDDFVRVIPLSERDDMVAAYYRRLTSDDPAVRNQAALAWSSWEGKTLSLVPNKEVEDHFINMHTALSLARIECHYFVHNTFLHEGELLDNAYRLKDIPGVIVHGRYDVVCPVNQAFALHAHWQQAQLQIVADAGHAASEPGIVHYLIEATDSMVKCCGA